MPARTRSLTPRTVPRLLWIGAAGTVKSRTPANPSAESPWSPPGAGDASRRWNWKPGSGSGGIGVPCGRRCRSANVLVWTEEGRGGAGTGLCSCRSAGDWRADGDAGEWSRGDGGAGEEEGLAGG